jgi:hypothetical protein
LSNFPFRHVVIPILSIEDWYCDMPSSIPKEGGA